MGSPEPDYTEKDYILLETKSKIKKSYLRPKKYKANFYSNFRFTEGEDDAKKDDAKKEDDKKDDGKKDDDKKDDGKKEEGGGKTGGTVPNEGNRKHVFEILDYNSLGFITYPSFVSFLKHSYSFRFFDQDNDGLTDVSTINSLMDQRICVIPLTKNEVSEVQIFEGYEIGVNFNFIQYLAFMMRHYLFKPNIIPNTSNLITKDALKTTFINKMGLRVQKTDIELTYAGPSPANNDDRAYNIEQIMKFTERTISYGYNMWKVDIAKKSKPKDDDKKDDDKKDDKDKKDDDKKMTIKKMIKIKKTIKIKNSNCILYILFKFKL